MDAVPQGEVEWHERATELFPIIKLLGDSWNHPKKRAAPAAPCMIPWRRSDPKAIHAHTTQNNMDTDSTSGLSDIQSGEKWTPDDISKLLERRKEYPEIPWRQFQEAFFPGRTLSSVTTKYRAAEKESRLQRSDCVPHDMPPNSAAFTESEDEEYLPTEIPDSDSGFRSISKRKRRSTGRFGTSPSGKLRKIEPPPPINEHSNTALNFPRASTVDLGHFPPTPAVPVSYATHSRDQDRKVANFRGNQVSISKDQRDISAPSPTRSSSSSSLLESIDISDWVLILTQAKECKLERARASDAQQRLLTLASRQAKDSAELERLKARLEHISQLPNWQDISLIDVEARLARLRDACEKLVTTSKSYMASLIWESAVIQESVKQMDQEFEEFNAMIKTLANAPMPPPPLLSPPIPPPPSAPSRVAQGDSTSERNQEVGMMP
ncbi:hypothetical protein FQN57_002227 [Myotisia sp. PD_48]|nr:hypothetical protein FQN57_002227 [Myotisia sp. PD_48]